MNFKKELIIGICLTGIFLGLTFYWSNKFLLSGKNLLIQTLKTEANKITSDKTVSLTKTEIAQHNQENSCWLIIEQKVYDVTAYLNGHPGGKQNLLDYCGKEATAAFNTKGGKGDSHSAEAQNLLANFYLGELNTKIDNQQVLKVKNQPTLPKTRKGEREIEDESE